MSKSQQEVQLAIIKREKEKIYGKPKKDSDYSRKQFYAELKSSRPDLAEAIKQRPRRRKFRAR